MSVQGVWQEFEQLLKWLAEYQSCDSVTDESAK
jgi:hypothetical protein